MFFGEPTHASFFGSEDEGEGPFEVELVEVFLCTIGGSDKPQAGFFELLHGSGEVGDLDKGNVIGCAHGNAPNGLGDTDGLVFGRDDGMDSSAIGGSQDGTEIVRILHAVKNQQEWLGGGGDDAHEVVFIERWQGFVLRWFDMAILPRLAILIPMAFVSKTFPLHDLRGTVLPEECNRLFRKMTLNLPPTAEEQYCSSQAEEGAGWFWHCRDGAVDDEVVAG